MTSISKTGFSPARPSQPGRHRDYAAARDVKLTAEAVRARPPRGVEAALARLRAFLENGEMPDRFLPPGSLLNILV